MICSRSAEGTASKTLVDGRSRQERSRNNPKHTGTGNEKRKPASTALHPCKGAFDNESRPGIITIILSDLTNAP